MRELKDVKTERSAKREWYRKNLIDAVAARKLERALYTLMYHSTVIERALLATGSQGKETRGVITALRYLVDGWERI